MKHIAFIVLVFFAVCAGAQSGLTLPEESPYATVSQRVGITDITVTYHSPAVKGRKIWGGIVPYNELWRAGANENTTISFTDDVSIGGQKVGAGIYGLHVLPGEKEWVIIFSKNHTSWGSFFYKKEEDAARVTVKPTEHEFTEWLTYSFTNKSSNSATLSLQWEKLQVSVQIDVDSKAIVFENIKQELRSTAGFRWEGYYEAANFCYNNQYQLEQGKSWIETAERLHPDEFVVLRLKSKYQEAFGDSVGAAATLKTALSKASEGDMNTYGYELLAQGKTKEAIEVFKTNVKNFPKSWNARDSLAEALAMSGNKAEAIKEYEQSLKNNPPAEHKTRIEETIKSLKGS
ncbi:MAG TPA: DUF2911 domain-containing protein [Bacteroidia bacterium]|nr:DUF2911 domain-containing protein [Bacteroidia bacterium]